MQKLNRQNADEQLYKLLVNNVKDYAIFMLDPVGQVLTWNEGAQRIKGYSAEEIIGQHFSQFYPPQAQQEAFPQLELNVAIQVGRFEDEGWRVRKDGSLFWANVVITATYDETGSLIGFSKVTRDLTERRRLEEELRQANQFLQQSQTRARLLIEGVLDYAILMLDPTGTITTWNIGAQRIKGYTAQEIIGQHFSLFYPPQAVQDGFPQYELRQALLEGRFEDEGWRVRKDGSLFWANVVITALYDEQRCHLGFAKITRDLTPRVRNEELMKKNQELLRINNDLDNFVYAASHDLKSPVTSLSALVGVLHRRLEGQLDEKSQELLKMIEDSSSRLQRTIRDLTQVAKVQRSTDEDKERIIFAELWHDIQADLQPMMLDANAHIVADFAAESLYYARPTARSILYNLVSNALKYRSSDRLPYITILTQVLNGNVVLEVSDNGLGLTHSQQQNLFTMFKRFHPHVEGSGIGLYMIKRMLENNGGRIEVESRVGEGTIFRIHF
ncbi:MAG: PAS domain-containing sensor histidine kinase [Bacteroidota bacterium]